MKSYFSQGDIFDHPAFGLVSSVSYLVSSVSYLVSELMNYLSHYYIDRGHPSTYFKLGLLLPDLAHGFNANLRRPLLNPAIVWNTEQQAVVDGVKRHFAIDAAFHNLPEFKGWMATLEGLMAAAPLQGTYIRRYFLAHIWVEWVIDRLLVKHREGLAIRFYKDMAVVNQSAVMALFAKVGKEQEGLDFFRIFRTMTDNQYLFRLPDNEIFTRALLNLYQRTVHITVPPADESLLIGITLQMETLIASELENLFTKLIAPNQ